MLQQFLQQRQQPNGMTQSQQPWQQRQGGWPSQQQQQPQDLGMFMQYLQPQQQQIAKTDSVEQLKANGVQPKQGGLMSKGS